MRRRVLQPVAFRPVRRGPPALPVRIYPRFESVEIGGLPVARLDRQQTARLLIDLAVKYRRRDRPWIATSINGQVLSEAARQPALREAVCFADVISCDGQPLVMASRRVTGFALPERVATTDLFHDVVAVARERVVSMYFLGGTEGENARAVAAVRDSYPHLRIVGQGHGYHTHRQWIGVVRDIDRLGPDIVWLGLGVPREQEFYMRFAHAMPNVGLIKTSGGLFNFLSASAARAPQWMQDNGLEWAYRMGREPRRLLFRYLTTSPHAAMLMLTRQKWGKGIAELGERIDRW
ncbi:Glycosyl transferase, WecB/TagA/CpsF family [Devosia sp. LC5]|uniref:WecB/TagA/CpsF family glycosyltransferase n=1 Tax=Devosia sp. LC5 TaxID=1502724 RepID=UPI0004E356FA|nr:WecB/TagA/CpsF family glycosyltransferase [Devosia sp. LC5]KFC62709.1 Glycosyl transferase, WecB/TagA/CpsF family [Devosia sp. LC5]